MQFLNILSYIALGLLGLDSIRAIIAMMGFVKPNAKYSWIIYGRYNKNLVESVLNEMGFSSTKSKNVVKNIKNISKDISNSTGVTEENSVKHLIALLAKYIVRFEHPIQYGGTKATKSRYYIDTMEIPHHEEDREILCAIMVHLINRYTKGSKKPTIIITPKSGNPLFAMKIAEYYGASFLMAKSDSDKSRIKSVGNDDIMDIRINYEGALNVELLSDNKCIALDCNTSSGSQLLNILRNLKNYTKKNSTISTISIPQEIYVLFQADDDHIDIDKKFEDNNCKLYRFFDLDEETKKDIYNLKEKYQNNGQAEIDIYCDEVNSDIESIIEKIKAKKHLHYNQSN